jgi:hypothetical protein|tara:strand:- start:2634 stop:2969 length:336 start_codon:yes stop_codon:yes gene_type:complete
MSQKLKTLGLVEITSRTQKKNGTVCFYDPIADCDYLSYQSGYVRRAYTRATYRSSRLHRTIYQLNKTTKGIYESKFDGSLYDMTERIMIPSEDSRLERLAHCAATYRNNKK